MQSHFQRGRFRWFAVSGCLFLTALSGCGGGGSSSGGSQAVSIASSSAPSDGCVTKAFAPNYVAESDPHTGLPNALRQWSHLPVRVYFAPGTLLTAARQSEVLSGFDWWTAGTGGLVSYTVTADAASADITISFEMSGATEYGALTTVSYDAANHLTQAAITFNMSYLNRDSLLPPAAAHEFGHALGIDGHSTQTGDVMEYSAAVYVLSSLSTRDVNTLKTDYSCGGTSKSVPAEARAHSAPVRAVTIYD